MRSPEVSSMSISRAGGNGLTCSARSSSSSVVSPMAETTTHTSWPALRVSTIRRATRLMLSAFVSEDPPYFWTTKLTGGSGLRWTAERPGYVCTPTPRGMGVGAGVVRRRAPAVLLDDQAHRRLRVEVDGGKASLRLHTYPKGHYR